MAPRVFLSLVVTLSLLFGGCFKKEQGEQFYGRVVIPNDQEFRWSDGGLPRVLDPARAAAPPDTDAVRALFEGLTDYEPATLRPVPGVASRWESSEGGRRWTFHLRTDARWSNGDPVTAHDFLRSWQRTLRLGELAPHANLLSNIEGAQGVSAVSQPSQQDAEDAVGDAPTDAGSRTAAQDDGRNAQSSPAAPPAFGVAAPDAHTLRVTLKRPDNNFPSLVSHTVFRPVHELSPGLDLSGLREEQGQAGSSELGIVTNGAFSLSRLAGDRVELERAASYWDARSVQLERVSFVDSGDPEAALAAYRAGELDAVTNAPVAPVAVKLLTTYKDFRRETFGALNYYGFNTARPPFDDRRVREALAVALDLERLSADTLGGSTEPAKRFLPRLEDKSASTASPEIVSEAVAKKVGERAASKHSTDEDKAGEIEEIEHSVERARKLLAEAGYPGGENFPRVRLLVNRNEQQRIVAQAVARMWRDALGIETEIIVRPWEEYEAMLRAGDYDVVRRSLVMQTTDEETNMLELFGDSRAAKEEDASGIGSQEHSPTGNEVESNAPLNQMGVRRLLPVLTESQALEEMPAIPLHFASSYALVKPYVEGFESNLLDAPSLKSVRINRDWRPPAELAP